MRTNYGNLSKAIIKRINNNFLVYAFSSKYKKSVNTHMHESKEEAILTRDDINAIKN